MQSIINHTFALSNGDVYSWGINWDEQISLVFDSVVEKTPHKLELDNTEPITNISTDNCICVCF